MNCLDQWEPCQQCWHLEITTQDCCLLLCMLCTKHLIDGTRITHKAACIVGSRSTHVYICEHAVCCRAGQHQQHTARCKWTGSSSRGSCTCPGGRCHTSKCLRCPVESSAHPSCICAYRSQSAQATRCQSWLCLAAFIFYMLWPS